MRQKALDLLSRFSYINGPVKIIRRCRPLGGQVVTLRDLFWHKEEPWCVVQLQSGMRTAIPLSWTDVPKDVVPTRMSAPQIEAPRLVEMSRFLQQMNAKTTKSTKRKSRRKSTRAK